MTADGLLVVDKPAGWTSHDVVARCRRLCQTRKVGHAGTLDPMATGVLVLGVNRATKLLTYLVGLDKAYDATIRLGQSTVTDDAEGEVTATTPVHTQELTGLPDAIGNLTGPIEQIPSAVSAIKIDGKRSYARVRAGEDVCLPARPVTVHEFTLHDLQVREPWTVDLQVSVEVSSGTYVRALARDLGDALGVGGHLTALRRTRVGRFTLAQAATLEAVETDGADAHLVPMADAAAAMFPVRRVLAEEERALRFGQQIGRGQPAAPASPHTPVAAIGPQGTLVALLDESEPPVRSLIVFPAD